MELKIFLKFYTLKILRLASIHSRKSRKL